MKSRLASPPLHAWPSPAPRPSARRAGRHAASRGRFPRGHQGAESAPARRRTRRIVAVEREVLAHERGGMRRRDDLVAVAVYCEQRHANLVRHRRFAHGRRDRFDVLLRSALQHADRSHAGFRRAARDARVHRDGADETREAHTEDRRERASRRHARDVDTACGRCDTAGAPNGSAPRRWPLRRRHATCDGSNQFQHRHGLAESFCVGRRTTHPFAVGELRDARAARDIVGRLLAAVEQHDERRSPEAGRTLWHVHEVVAARPYGGCAADPAMRGELRSLLEASRRRLAAEPAADALLEADATDSGAQARQIRTMSYCSCV